MIMTTGVQETIKDFIVFYPSWNFWKNWVHDGANWIWKKKYRSNRWNLCVIALHIIEDDEGFIMK